MQQTVMRVCAVIPSYRNAGTVLDVLSRTLAQIPDVILVNDGSPDDTETLVKESGLDVTLVSYPVNRGKGAALMEGFRKASELGFDYAVTLDSDGQHFPEDIPLFLDAIRRNPGAIITGSRNLAAENMPGKNSFANRFSNFWFAVQTLRRIPDTQTGFRAYPLAKLPCTALLTSRYEAELELLVFSAWKGVEIVPVGIRVHYPPAGERITSFRPFADFFRISVLNTVLCLVALVYGYPSILIHKITGRR